MICRSTYAPGYMGKVVVLPPGRKNLFSTGKQDPSSSISTPKTSYATEQNPAATSTPCFVSGRATHSTRARGVRGISISYIEW